MKEPQKIPASFRDPSGFLFRREGVLYRQVNVSYQEHYDRLMESGLYQTLTEAELLVPHDEVQEAPLNPKIAYKIVRPKSLSFISYPYEWCFSQLKNAALTTLAIQKIALEHNMSLKDSSAYNIQFHNGNPTLIDTARPGRPWSRRSGGEALDLLQTILPAFSGAPCTHGIPGCASRPVVEGVHRRRTA